MCAGRRPGLVGRVGSGAAGARFPGRVCAMVPAVAAPRVWSSPGWLGATRDYCGEQRRVSRASPGGRGAGPGIPIFRDPLPVPQGSCLLWLGLGTSLPCPCFVPADCFSFCFPSSPSLPCLYPCLVTVPASSPSLSHLHRCLVIIPASFPIFLIPLPAVSPSLPCPLPCLLSHFPSPLSGSLSLPVPIPASFPIFPHPSPSRPHACLPRLFPQDGPVPAAPGRVPRYLLRG